MRAGLTRKLTVVVACVAALTIAPAAASAARAVYHPKKEARDFANGDGNWKGASSHKGGLCVEGLTCPQVTNTYEASDGAGGGADGHLRTSIGALNGVAVTSDGTYTSPAFTYKGVKGEAATKAKFSIARNSDLTELLAVPGNSATYSVDLIDTTNGKSTTLINDMPLDDTGGWLTAKPTKVRARSLKMGHSYKLRITSEFVTGAAMVGGGFADYDNVKLIVRGAKGSGGPGTGGPKPGPIGGGIKPVKVSKGGKRIRVPYKCPKSTKPSACDARLSVSLTRHGKQATQNRTVRVRPGHKRVAQLKVKHAFRHKVATHGKVFVHGRIRAKGHVYHVTRKVSMRQKG